MKLLWLYLLAFLCLPIIGEITIYFTGISITAGTVDINLIIANTVFVAIVLSVAYYLANFKVSSKYVQKHFHKNYSNRILKKIIIILIVISFFIFMVSGYSVLFSGESRGDIRVSLGILGPFYSVSLTYIPVMLVVYASAIYSATLEKKKLKNKLLIIFILLIVIGVFSGYKAVAVTLMVPGFVILYFDNFKIKHFFLFLFLFLLVLTLFTALVRDMPIDLAFSFLIYRMTTMTAYGTIGVWNEFNDIISFNDLLINFVSIFGNKISAFILGISQHDVEFLKTSLSRLITYLVYPNREGALSGTVNVTVTNFGHALYLFGKYLYPFYALFMGVMIGVVIRKIKIYRKKQLPLKLSMIVVLFFSAIIPSINSGGIFTLISLPVLINLFITYLIGRYLIQERNDKYAIID